MTQPSDPSPSEVPIRPRHLHAPQGDGETLIEPKIEELYLPLYSRGMPEKFYLESKLYQSGKCTWGWKSLLDQAIAYTRSYRDTSTSFPSSLHAVMVLAGHQPTLFHPGVWLKNFQLDRFREWATGIPINLVIDNDVAGSASIRIPAGSSAKPIFEEFPLDEPFENVPFEERPIVAPEFVRQFARRLSLQFSASDWFQSGADTQFIADKFAQHLEIPRQGKPEFPLGETLSRARHRLEQDLGLQTLELPLSHVVKTETFRQFAHHLFQHLPRFQEIYNRSLAEYRIVNKIRSNSHPVPALIADGEWLEAPFWIWTKENPRRRRLFTRQERFPDGERYIGLSDRGQITDATIDGSIDRVPEALQHWQFLEATHGIKIRPRALITTMYARLFLSDLFIHGIGGAKYDELTDAIIRRFFGIEPPAYMTVTGTVRLPIPRPEVSAADVLNTKQLIREIRFHPEKFVNDASPAIRESATQFAAKKTELLLQHQFHFRGASPEQFRALDDLNRQLQLLLTDVEIRLRDELKDRERDLHSAKILGSREFSFVLHPADTLPEQLKTDGRFRIVGFRSAKARVFGR